MPRFGISCVFSRVTSSTNAAPVLAAAGYAGRPGPSLADGARARSVCDRRALLAVRHADRLPSPSRLRPRISTFTLPVHSPPVLALVICNMWKDVAYMHTPYRRTGRWSSRSRRSAFWLWVRRATTLSESTGSSTNRSLTARVPRTRAASLDFHFIVNWTPSISDLHF